MLYLILLTFMLVAIGVMIIFLIILGLCIKLYTEYFKDVSRTNKRG